MGFARRVAAWVIAPALALAAVPAQAQILLYAQRLPEGTVYVRLVNALPGAASVKTDFAGTVELGGTDAARISPYFIAGSAGGKTVALQVTASGKTATASFSPKSGTFITVVLHGKGDAVTAAIVTDKPEYNQLKARLSFYNATADCAGGTLVEGAGKSVFSNMAPDSGAALSLNPVAAKVTASCAAGKAAAVDLGKLNAGGLYSVWLMQPGGSGAPISFVANDTIAPPRS